MAKPTAGENRLTYDLANSSFPARPLRPLVPWDRMEQVADLAARDALRRVSRALKWAGPEQTEAVLNVLLDPRRGGLPIVLEALDGIADQYAKGGE